jgi:8-oxo-dGTP pyrophosphatase MutT (NUDIX family)
MSRCQPKVPTQGILLQNMPEKTIEVPCGHSVCASFHTPGSNVKQTAAVAAILHYNMRGSIIDVIGLGLERFGQYRGKYNLCAGSAETDDFIAGVFCWVKCAVRELSEEFKIDVVGQDMIRQMFCNDKGVFRVFTHNTTPVFIIILPKGTSRRPIKQDIELHIKNHPNKAYREIGDFEWFRIDNHEQLEGKRFEISKFADDVITRIYKRKNLLNARP